MSFNSSPSKQPTTAFGDEYDRPVDMGFDLDYTTEISMKMTVPKNIRVGTGATSDESDIEENLNREWNRVNAAGQAEKMKMQVPDRIMVRGHEQHLGTKALPREMQLDSVIMPPDPELIRIQTPPRSITLLDQPKAKVQSNGHNYRPSEGDEDTLVVENDRAAFIVPEGIPNGPMRSMGIGGSSFYGTREGSIGPGEMDDIQNEVEHLREQLGRVSRRMFSIENDLSERKDRETYIIAAGILYIAIQAFRWIFRSQHR